MKLLVAFNKNLGTAMGNTCSGESGPSDKGGPGHPDPEKRGGGGLPKFFSALRAPGEAWTHPLDPPLYM